MDLSSLYPRGTPMSEVHPNFRGMPLAEWLSKQIHVQAVELKDMPTPVTIVTRASKKPLSDRRIVTPRDEYGMKRLRGDAVHAPGVHVPQLHAPSPQHSQETTPDQGHAARERGTGPASERPI